MAASLVGGTAAPVLTGYLIDAWGQPVDSATREALWAKAAWAVFIGMICDVLDGLAVHPDDNGAAEAKARQSVKRLCDRFPIYQTL